MFEGRSAVGGIAGNAGGRGFVGAERDIYRDGEVEGAYEVWCGASLGFSGSVAEDGVVMTAFTSHSRLSWAGMQGTKQAP
jgi:hypothetical protein